MTDATQQGVSEDQGQELTPEEIRGAEQAELRSDTYGRSTSVRESVAERYERERAERLGLPIEEAEGDDGDQGAAPAVAPRPEVRQEEQEAPPPQKREVQRDEDGFETYLNDQGVRVMKLRIDGVDEEVPVTKAKASIQKNFAADRRLQHATELLRTAEERAAAIEERERRLRETMSGPRPVSDEDAEREAKHIIDKLLDGEADEAAKELAKAMRRGPSTPIVDQAELEERAAQRALSKISEAEYHRDVAKGTQLFSEKYPEIVDDPDLFFLANQKTIDLQKTKPYLTPTEILLEAGEYVAKRFGRPSARSSGAPATQSPARQQRKDQLKPMPRPATARTERPAPPRVPTKEDWIAEQRRLRGQR